MSNRIFFVRYCSIYYLAILLYGMEMNPVKSRLFCKIIKPGTFGYLDYV